MQSLHHSGEDVFTYVTPKLNCLGKLADSHMSSRIVRAWIVSLALASVLALLGFAAHREMWGMWIPLPGIAVALLFGWAVSYHSYSQTLLNVLVIGTTVVLNAICCFYASRLFVRMALRPANMRRRVQS